MKKKLSLLLLLTCILNALNINATVYSGSCGTNANYSLDTETGILSITGTGAMNDYSSSSAPWDSYKSDIETVEIADGVTSIGGRAFDYYSALTSVTIGNNVTTIGDKAFEGCSGLTSVTIGNSVTEIGYEAFYRCSVLTSITIPNSVTSIGDKAFCDCYKLASVTLDNSVTEIGEFAFQNSGLTSIEIPNSATSIKLGAFCDCKSLTSIVVGSGNTKYDSRNNCKAIIETSTNSLVAGCKNTIIPNSVTSIGQYAFSGCTELTSVTIPSSVTSIGQSAFRFCTGLTSVTIPNSVTLIANWAFYGSSALTSVTIPNSVTSIGNSAFYLCSKLKYVTSQIKEPFAFGSNAFLNIDSYCKLTIPHGTSSAYVAAGWTSSVFQGGIVEQSSVNVDMSSYEIGTFCCPYDLDFSDVSGLKAYIMSGFSPSTSTLVLTPVTQVPAYTGLLLKGDEGSYEVPCTTTDMYYTNLLKGVTTATEIDPTDGDYTNFILSNGIHGIGFYTLSESGELAANKAYLQLPTASVSLLARAISLVFEDEITSIDEMKAETKGENNIFFDMQGRRIDNPTQGLYIVNGKKVFINK